MEPSDLNGIDVTLEYRKCLKSIDLSRIITTEQGSGNLITLKKFHKNGTEWSVVIDKNTGNIRTIVDNNPENALKLLSKAQRRKMFNKIFSCVEHKINGPHDAENASKKIIEESTTHFSIGMSSLDKISDITLEVNRFKTSTPLDSRNDINLTISTESSKNLSYFDTSKFNKTHDFNDTNTLISTANSASLHIFNDKNAIRNVTGGLSTRFPYLSSNSKTDNIGDNLLRFFIGDNLTNTSVNPIFSTQGPTSVFDSRINATKIEQIDTYQSYQGKNKSEPFVGFIKVLKNGINEQAHIESKLPHESENESNFFKSKTGILIMFLVSGLTLMVVFGGMAIKRFKGTLKNNEPPENKSIYINNPAFKNQEQRLLDEECPVKGDLFTELKII